jgi:hypothetical protein
MLSFSFGGEIPCEGVAGNPFADTKWRQKIAGADRPPAKERERSERQNGKRAHPNKKNTSDYQLFMNYF